MKNLIEELAQTGIVRVTGSYADGTFTDASDIDFYVIPDKSGTPINKRNMLKIISVLERFDIKWRSNIPGYIFTHSTAGNDCLERQLEFSELYKPRKNKLKSVKLYGTEFKTY